MKNREASWLIRTRNVLCALYLMLFVLFEIYSASATALGNSHRFPAWEAMLGWCMFVLPCLLVTGVFLLLREGRGNTGFALVGLSVLLYVAFMFLEVALIPEHIGRGDGVFIGIFIMLGAFATAAAWLIKRSI